MNDITFRTTVMTDRNYSTNSISSTIGDYRQSDHAAPTPEHVERWVNQFDAAVQLPILREMDHVLKQTYFSKENTQKFLNGLFDTTKLVGNDPCTFWRSVNFLNIQGGGASQTEMLALFDQLLQDKCGFSVSDCGSKPHAFIYLDDASFTGNRILRDLRDWIAKKAPAKTTVHIITIAQHSGGQYYANTNLIKAVQAAGKTIDFTWWRAIELEDRLTYTDTSDVLRPVAIPEDTAVQAYVAGMKYAPRLRTPGGVGGKGIFSSDENRQLLEQEFLKAGMRIRGMCPHLGNTQRPLGHMTLETLGFGSLLVTFRNCPNNAPLALWAGDPWYPLFPRTTNSATSVRNFMAMLARGRV